MKPRFFALIMAILLWSCVPTGCGGVSATGGSIGCGSPTVSFSPNSLTFGDEVEGTVSQPLPVTLTNSGTATLTITSIATSANFAQTNKCGPTLASGANCTINVTLTPNTTGSVSGTVSFTDNAPRQPANCFPQPDGYVGHDDGHTDRVLLGRRPGQYVSV
jgi:Abnormal spindle-like microcephaly-assoc'd, ASPM-SPD-2-Hydin